MVAAAQAYNAYQNANVYEGMDPNRLILMLYEGALLHLELSKEGLLAKDAKKRGEHMGKAIAIIGELNASLDSKVKDEPIEFLRGLYMALLVDLPRVAITNDVGIIDRAHKYISLLCDIWKKNVMDGDHPTAQPKETAPSSKEDKTECSASPSPPAHAPNRAANAYAAMGRLGGISFSA